MLSVIMCNVVFCQEVSAEEPLFSSSLWGPSADDLDQVMERCLLPELSVGDWLLFSDAGANGLGATFTNGEEHKPPVFYSITERDWYGVNLDVAVRGISNPVHLFCFLIKLFFLSVGKSCIIVASLWTWGWRISLWYHVACNQTYPRHPFPPQRNIKPLINVIILTDFKHLRTWNLRRSYACFEDVWLGPELMKCYWPEQLHSHHNWWIYSK